MKKLLTTDNYIQRFNCNKLDHPNGYFHLSIDEQLLTAKNPDERHVKYDVTLSPAQLEQFVHAVNRITQLSLLETA